MARHDAFRWWQGHHHPTGNCQRSLEVTWLSQIVGGDLPSFLSFRPAGGGTWAVADCRNDVVRLAYFGQRSGQPYIRIGYGGRPDVVFASVVCFSLRESG